MNKLLKIIKFFSLTLKYKSSSLDSSNSNEYKNSIYDKDNSEKYLKRKNNNCDNSKIIHSFESSDKACNKSSKGENYSIRDYSESSDSKSFQEKYIKLAEKENTENVKFSKEENLENNNISNICIYKKDIIFRLEKSIKEEKFFKNVDLLNKLINRIIKTLKLIYGNSIYESKNHTNVESLKEIEKFNKMDFFYNIYEDIYTQDTYIKACIKNYEKPNIREESENKDKINILEKIKSLYDLDFLPKIENINRIINKKSYINLDEIKNIETDLLKVSNSIENLFEKYKEIEFENLLKEKIEPYKFISNEEDYNILKYTELMTLEEVLHLADTGLDLNSSVKSVEESSIDELLI